MPIPVSLAPMEGVTTFPTRLFFALTAPPQVMTTPFLRATPTFPHKALPEAFAPELGLGDAVPYRLELQVMAADEDDFLKAAAMAPPSVTSI